MTVRAAHLPHGQKRLPTSAPEGRGEGGAGGALPHRPAPARRLITPTAPDDTQPLHLVREDGHLHADGRAWSSSATAADRKVLARAEPPVLDVGCGPGRHVEALQRVGADVLGIDVTPSILEDARRRGLAVIAASVFDPLPRMSQWQTALLLDGNTGLGGSPLGLLLRLRRVLTPTGRVLADLATERRRTQHSVRLRHGARLGPAFGWAPLHVDDLRAVAGSAGFEVIDCWQADHRWYCELQVTGSIDAAPSGVTDGWDVGAPHVRTEAHG